ncbi:acyltransferase [Massilia sp. 9I]|uniref:acyltransferase family protein n=1 Tax=Massilia sp. 9I TaxID=2653152 RepID=UPI0012F0AB0D|nr:acyltransferase [Massilia sp. 9I]VXB33195.1 conserved membrane hypothetical protein [Massilia sp. 9I]
MTQHVPYLDGWRGLAVSCLLLGHFFPVPGFNFGTVGVALFFVLSGMLMTRVLFVQRCEIGTFYRRRISRVFPSLFAYIGIITLLFIASDQPFDPAEILTALTFTNNYFVAEKWTLPFGHIWSLSVEEHSYVILSIAAIWCRWRGCREVAVVSLILLLILSVIAIYSLSPDGFASNFALRTEVASFGIFFSGLLFLLGARHKVRLSKPWIAPATLALGILCHWWSVHPAIKVVIGWGALALAINAMSAAPAMIRRFLENPWLQKLGLYSFSLYLWQQPFYQLHRHHGMPALVALLLSLVTGYLAFRFVENPARIYLNTHWRPANIGGTQASSVG